MTLGCMNDAAYRPLVSCMCYLLRLASAQGYERYTQSHLVLSVLKLEIDWMPRTYARLEVSVVAGGQKRETIPGDLRQAHRAPPGRGKEKESFRINCIERDPASATERATRAPAAGRVARAPQRGSRARVASHLHNRTLIFRTAHAVGASLMRASLVPGPAPDRQQETDRTLGSRRTLHNYIRINQACATRAL